MLTGIEKFVYDLYSIRYRTVYLMNGNTRYKIYHYKLHEPIINEFGWFISPDNDAIMNFGIHEIVFYDIKDAMPEMLVNKKKLAEIRTQYANNKSSIIKSLIMKIPVFSYDKELRTRIQKEEIEYLNQSPLNIDASTLHIKHLNPLDYKNTLNMNSYGKILKKQKEPLLNKSNVSSLLLYGLIGVAVLVGVYLVFSNHLFGL